jgi:hypothetical protein
MLLLSPAPRLAASVARLSQPGYNTRSFWIALMSSGGGDTGATLRRLIRQVPPRRCSAWVMAAAVRMVIGWAGSTMSRIEWTTASSGPSP